MKKVIPISEILKCEPVGAWCPQDRKLGSRPPSQMRHGVRENCRRGPCLRAPGTSWEAMVPRLLWTQMIPARGQACSRCPLGRSPTWHRAEQLEDSLPRPGSSLRIEVRAGPAADALAAVGAAEGASSGLSEPRSPLHWVIPADIAGCWCLS